MAERVGKIGGDKHSAERNDGDGKQPQVPSDDETYELVEAEFGPLIKPSLQRHQAIQVNDDCGLRNVKKSDGEQPKYQVSLTKFCRCSHPARANDEENLSKDEVAEGERFL